jgi:hypothetical protein
MATRHDLFLSGTIFLMKMILKGLAKNYTHFTKKQEIQLKKLRRAQYQL